MTVKVAFKGQRLSKVAFCPSCPPPDLPMTVTHFGGFPLSYFQWANSNISTTVDAGYACLVIQEVLQSGMDWSYQFFRKTSGPMPVDIAADSWYYFTPTAYTGGTGADVVTNKGVVARLQDSVTDNYPVKVILENDIIFNPLGYGG